jgi:hypothetical protein
MFPDQTGNDVGDFLVAWNSGTSTIRRIRIDLVFGTLASHLAAEGVNLSQEFIVAHTCNPLVVACVFRQQEFNRGLQERWIRWKTRNAGIVRTSVVPVCQHEPDRVGKVLLKRP